MTEFTHWLKIELSRRGWSQAELARRAGLSKSGVSYVLTGARIPGALTVAAIARALDLPEDQVFEKAGLLSATIESPGANELLHLFTQLSLTDQEEIIEFVRLKLKRSRGKTTRQ